jgi:hypothetical protein
MSGASYRRGSAVISRQICIEYGCSGCTRCRECKPTPRPAVWGSKAAARALDVAQRTLSGMRRYGLPEPDIATLALAVRERARVGEATAESAARVALANSK